METAGDGPLRRPELIAALTLGMDLGLGQPTEHVLRTCLLSMRLGERFGASPADLETAYHVALLSAVGCTADSSELAEFFGDDIEFRRCGVPRRSRGPAAVRLHAPPCRGAAGRRGTACAWPRRSSPRETVAAAESMAGHCDARCDAGRAPRARARPARADAPDLRAVGRQGRAGAEAGRDSARRPPRAGRGHRRGAPERGRPGAGARGRAKARRRRSSTRRSSPSSSATLTSCSTASTARRPGTRSSRRSRRRRRRSPRTSSTRR